MMDIIFLEFRELAMMNVHYLPPAMMLLLLLPVSPSLSYCTVWVAR